MKDQSIPSVFFPNVAVPATKDPQKPPPGPAFTESGANFKDTPILIGPLEVPSKLKQYARCQ